MTITPAQSRAARGLLGWSQTELADAAGVSQSTVADFERGRRHLMRNNHNAIMQALQKGGVKFIADGVVLAER